MTARVGYVAFDALEIPFEIASASAEGPVETRMCEILAVLKVTIEALTARFDAAEVSKRYLVPGQPMDLSNTERQKLVSRLGGFWEPAPGGVRRCARSLGDPAQNVLVRSPKEGDDPAVVMG